MRVRVSFYVLVFILTHFLSYQTFPQTYIPEKIQFKHLTKENGLSGNSIWCVLKDKKGFIWIGTHEGLNRYNGIKFKEFKYSADDKNSLSGNEVTALLEDRSGNLWVGTGGGLNKYNNVMENFIRYIYPGDSSKNTNYVRALFEDNKGVIWFGTHHGGLFRFNPVSEEFSSYKNIPGDTTSLSHNYIWSIKEDSKGNLWIGTAGGGLNKFNPKDQTFTRYQYHPDHPNGLSNNIIRGICEDKSGALWLGTYGGGICRLTLQDDNSHIFTNYKYTPDNPYGLSDANISGMYIDKNNVLWFGTGGGGLHRSKSYLDDSSALKFIYYKHNPNDPTSISGNIVPHLYEDNSGLLWIATIGDGLNIFDKKQKQFKQYRHDPGNPFSLSGNDVLVMYEDRSGTIWISTRRDGLNKWDRTTDKFTHYKNIPNDPNSLSDNRVYSIYEDRMGTMWFGTYYGGLNGFDKKTGKFFTYKNNPSNPKSISGNGIFSIVEDKSGTLWIGTLDHGINKFDRKTNSFHNINYNPDSLKIFKSILYGSIQLIDKSGTLWIGDKKGGLIAYDVQKDEMISYKHVPNNSNSLSSNIITVVYQDKSGTFWFGTDDGGLTKFDKVNNQFTRYNMKNGLPSNTIFDILDDERGNLWISTNNGLSKFNPKTESFRNYDTEDGLLSNEFERYTNSCKTKENELIFSNGNGFIIFHPDSLKDNIKIPPVYITDFYLFNKHVPIGYDSLFGRTVLAKSITECEEIKLNYDDNVFAFEFAALDYSAPMKNRYAYMMQGFDKDWTYTNAKNASATYTNLDPGEYIFRVKGSNNDGYWNEQGASIKVIILPPWWRTNIAYLIYFLLIGSIIYFIWKAQLRRIKIKHEYEMSKFAAQKLHEVDEVKSRFFTNISHEFRTPLTLILGPAKDILETTQEKKTKQNVSLIKRNAGKLLLLVNQLLDISKIESGNMKLETRPRNIIPLLKGLVSSFSSYAEKKRITLGFNSTEDEIIVYVEQDKFEKIITNILSNALKFTPEGGSVEVNIYQSKSRINIKVIDNGIGIPADRIEKIFDRFYQVDGSHTREHEGTGIGLSLIKELVDLHKGKISVESEPGKGSTFTVSFPLGKEHLSPEEICEEDEESAAESEPRQKRDFDYKKEISKADEEDVAAWEGTDNELMEKDSLPLLLVVEDNPDVRSYIKENLKTEFRIIEAADGEDGWEKSVEHIPDLIVSDVMMPKLSGFKLCEKLKTDELTSHIPVILLTAKAAKEDKLAGYELGADEYLMKPFDTDELKSRIKNLIVQRKRLQEHFRIKGFTEIDQLKITPVDKKFLEKSIEIINKNLSRTEFGVEELANDLAISRSLLFKKINALIGEPPSELIKRTRLIKAASLIEYKSDNISQIALEVGFSNPSYFTECFRKQYGVAPSHYHSYKTK